MDINQIVQKEINDLTVAEITYLYIDLNLSQLEITKLFNLKSNKKTQRLIEKYEIKKSKDKVIERTKKTNLERYGVTSPILTDKVRQKTNDVLRSEVTQEKRKATMKNKYGVTSFFEKSDVKDKAKQTIKERYDVDNVMQVSKIIDKAKTNREETNISKYGVSNQFQRQEIQDKRSEVLISKFGTDNLMQINEIKNKKMKTVYDNENMDFETYQIVNNKDRFIEYLNSIDTKQTINELAEHFNLSSSRIAQIVREFDIKDLIDYSPNHSSYEDEIVEYLQSLNILNIDRNTTKILTKKELDIYLPDYKIAIEFNGDYWHSTVCRPDKKYHYNKSLECEKLGIRLIHIYEYEWKTKKEILKSLLKIALGKVDTKIYARSCEIRTLTNKEAKPFNTKNHLQGHRNAQVTYGLFYKNELVQLMSFSRHKKYKWEIIRGCPGSNNIVIGGVSRLIHKFKTDYDPDQLFSYCDFNKFDGYGYEKSGMKFIGYTGPDKKIIIDGEVKNRNPAKYSEYKNKEYAEIWGSGSKKYIWIKEK